MKIFFGLFAVFVMSSGAFGFEISLVGPGGEVMIYYKDGNDVVVRNCGKDYPDIKNRSDCTTVGQENRVPIDVFKRALRSEFQMSFDEVKASTQAESDQQTQLASKKKELEARLERIKKFANNPQIGCDKQCKEDQANALSSLSTITKELGNVQKGEAARQASLDKINAAIQKMNASIDDLVDKKIASPDLKTVSATNDKADYELLNQFDASRAECGTDDLVNRTSAPAPAQARRIQSVSAPGIGARMNDCLNLPKSSIKYHNTKTGQDVIWKLVTRKRDPSTGKFYEVWQDSHSGVLWGDRLDNTYSQYDAAAQCGTDEGKRAAAGISEKSFKLPTKEDFEKAKEDGIADVLPNKDPWFWSSSVYSYDNDFAWDFSGYSGNFDFDYRSDQYSVRCVGR